MDTELKKILEENLELSRENNKMLKRLRNAQKWATISRLLYWVVALALAYGAYVYVEPYIRGFTNFYNTNKSYLDEFKSTSDQFKNFGGIFNKNSTSGTPTQQ